MFCADNDHRTVAEERQYVHIYFDAFKAASHGNIGFDFEALWEVLYLYAKFRYLHMSPKLHYVICRTVLCF